MQPCHICGAAGTDAGGFCLNCRTYRGTAYAEPSSQIAEQYAYGATGSPAMVSGGPAVFSGGPYPAPVTHAIDGMQPPTSGGPAALAPPRRSVAMISFMLVAGALVVVLGALVVVLVNTGGDRSVKNAAAGTSTSAATAPASAPPASPSALASLDGCAIGTWVTTSEFMPLDADGKTGLTTKSGAIWRLGPDGTGEVDYGSGVGYTGKVDGKKAEAWLAGKATFEYSTVNRALNLSNYKPDIRAIYIVDNVVKNNWKVPLENQTATYACSKDALTFSPDGDHPATLRRQ